METKMQNELIEILEKQEELLVFEKFDEDDAWNIGNSIRQKIIAYGGDGLWPMVYHHLYCRL